MDVSKTLPASGYPGQGLYDLTDSKVVLNGTPSNLAGVRHHNMQGILQSIHNRAPVTRNDLIAGSGLNRVTVLDIVSELQAKGLIQESGQVTTGKSGRPAKVLEMDDTRVAVGALEINVDHISLRCATLQGRIVFNKRLDITVNDHSPEEALQLAAQLINEATRSLAVRGMELVRINVGCPAFVNNKTGTVLKSESLGWENIAVIRELTRNAAPGVTYTLDRLANLAINAERVAGGWSASDGILMLYGDMGVGGAFQKNSETLVGDSGRGAEFGHLSVNYDGRHCYCGSRGCLETYVGLGPLSKALARGGSKALTAIEVLAEVAEGGAQVRVELAQQATHLARALAAFSTIFDPRVIILGGHLTSLVPLMQPVLTDELEVRRSKAGTRTELQVSSMGIDAILAGGLFMATNAVVRFPWKI